MPTFLPITPLSRAAFDATFTPPMRDITATAEEAAVDIWPYVDRVLATEYADADTDAWDVDYVYANPTKPYQHVLIHTSMAQVYLVVVVNVARRAVHGHHLLNLNRLYNLDH